jgi:hypothetical protein
LGFPTFRIAGVDWVLDQHKEKKVRDRTVEAWLKDNPDARHRFAEHKEAVIDLIARVSVETIRIVAAPGNSRRNSPMRRSAGCISGSFRPTRSRNLISSIDT